MPRGEAGHFIAQRNTAPGGKLPLNTNGRAWVTVALAALKTAELIHNTNGRVTIIDRHGLEAASC